MPKADKPPKYRGIARNDPLKGFDALKKEKAEAKAERKRVHMLKVATIRFRLLRANRSTSQLTRAGNTFNEIATQFQNLSLEQVDPETEPRNFNMAQAHVEAQVQTQVHE